MTSRISKQHIILPEFGKKQISLKNFSWKINSSKSFIIYLPCAKQKPYYLSSTHIYFKKKIKEFLPPDWDSLIQICTISEVIGIIPEDLEDTIFSGDNRKKYDYEHYPTHKENDIENTRKWLIQFIQNHEKQEHLAYLTSKTFQEICSNILQLCVFPTEFNPSSALFEFRKSKNVEEFCNYVVKRYIKILKSRYIGWKKKNTQAFQLINKFKDKNSFKITDIKDGLPNVKNPYSLIYRLCHEGKNMNGIILKRIDRGIYQIKEDLI